MHGLVAAILALRLQRSLMSSFSEWFQKHLYSIFAAFCFLCQFSLVFQQRQEKSEMTLNRIFDILVNFIISASLDDFTVLLYAYVGKIILKAYYQKACCLILLCLT